MIFLSQEVLLKFRQLGKGDFLSYKFGIESKKPAEKILKERGLDFSESKLMKSAFRSDSI